MKIIRFLKKHPLGSMGETTDVTDGQANYLVRMKVAEFADIDFEEDWYPEGKEKAEDEAVVLTKEKKEFKPEQEKQSHTGLPTATKKKGRPKKSG